MVSSWVSDGSVFAVAAGQRAAYIAGQFESLSPYTGSWVALDRRGRADRSWPVVAGEVDAAVADGRGGWFIGGSFTSVGGVPQARLAHITVDRRVDRRWTPRLSSGTDEAEVRALVRWKSMLFVGGSFDHVGGKRRPDLAAVDISTGAVAAWDPSPNGSITALAVHGNTLYVSGAFNDIGGGQRRYLAALDPLTGAATTWNPASSDRVDAIVPVGPVVYVGGSFDRIGGRSRHYLATLSAATANATGWDPHPNATPKSIAVRGSIVYVGGGFTEVGGQHRAGIAALDARAGRARPWNPNSERLISSGSEEGIVDRLALSVDGNTVYASGIFDEIGGAPRKRLAAIDAASGRATNWAPLPNDDVTVIEPSNSRVFVGGRFKGLGGVLRDGLAAVDLTTGAPTSWNPPYANGWVTAVALSGSTLYIGGGFTRIGGEKRHKLAALSTDTGALLPWQAQVGADANVNRLALDGSRLYAGGLRFLEAVDTEDGTSVWKASPSDHVRALAASGSTVIVGGSFSSISDTRRVFLAALDGATGAVTNWRPLVRGPDVFAVAPRGNRIYVGGTLDQHGLLAFDSTTGARQRWAPRVSGAVHSVAIGDRVVYAGGDFTAIGGRSQRALAAFNIATGKRTSWKPSITGTVYALSLRDRTLFAAGKFGYAIFRVTP